jgi:hypothetical protein
MTTVLLDRTRDNEQAAAWIANFQCPVRASYTRWRIMGKGVSGEGVFESWNVVKISETDGKAFAIPRCWNSH